MISKSKRYFSLLYEINKYISSNYLNLKNGIQLDKALFDQYFLLALAVKCGKSIDNIIFSLELSTKGVWCLVLWDNNNPILVVYPTSRFSPDEKIKFCSFRNIPCYSEKILVEDASLLKIISTCYNETLPLQLISMFNDESAIVFKKYARKKHLLVMKSCYLDLFRNDYQNIINYISTSLRVGAFKNV